MSDKPNESSTESKEKQKASAKTKALILSIASSALLISFAAYTLLKTDFKTYPVDIAEVTKQPEAFVTIDYNDEDAAPSFEDLLAINEEPEANESTPPEPQRDVELEALQDRCAVLEYDLAQKSLEVASLNERLDDKIRQLNAIAELPQLTKSDEEESDSENLAKNNEELRLLNVKLESQLVEVRNRLKQHQDAFTAKDDMVRDLDNRVRELTRRQDSLQKEKDLLAKDKAFLESKASQNQQKLAAQEHSFQELSVALKKQKEAMKRIDQSRIELASELEAAKTQYSKLLNAVAAKAKEAPGSASTKNNMDHLTTMAPESTTTNRQPLASEDGQTRYHVVGKGDTLTSVSRQYYGTSKRWHEIYDANQVVVTDHNRLKVGVVLVIP
ncbi:MAG: LysM peptidoglycan-binding domain-containing protein [Nitrosomonas sp.]|nr:MAG: LysM peptidoglycan-binding domain-containing protein [Nitrosomonas sp.]